MSLAGVNVHELAAFIKHVEKSGGPRNRAETAKLSKARLKMACWVCKTEAMEPNMHNIAEILGEDFKSVIPFVSEVKVELGADGPVV